MLKTRKIGFSVFLVPQKTTDTSLTVVDVFFVAISCLVVCLFFIKVVEFANLWKVQNMVIFTDSSFGKENMLHLVAGLLTGWRDP